MRSSKINRFTFQLNNELLLLNSFSWLLFIIPTSQILFPCFDSGLSILLIGLLLDLLGLLDWFDNRYCLVLFLSFLNINLLLLTSFLSHTIQSSVIFYYYLFLKLNGELKTINWL